CSVIYIMVSGDPEGLLYYVISDTTDGAGNIMVSAGPTTTGRTYDKTLPTATYVYLGSDTSPGATYTKTGTPAVYSDASDTNGVLAQFSYDSGSSWSDAAAFTSGTTTVDLTSGTQGDRTVRIKFWDASGNQKVATLSDIIVFDNVSPALSVSATSVTLANPGYAIENSVISLTLSTSESTSGMKTAPSVTLRKANDDLIATLSVSGPAGSGPYIYTATHTMDNTDPEVALYYRISGAEDNAGNIMVAGNLVDLSRTYDRTVPSPNITAPSASAYVNADATMAITADGGSLTAKIGTNTASAYISGTTKISSLSGWGSIAEGGNITITVYSSDTAGDIGETTITFKKDTVKPALTVSATSVTLANPGYAIENSVISLTLSTIESTSGMKTAPSVTLRKANDDLIATLSVSGPTGTGPYIYTATYTMDDTDPEGALYYRISGAEDNAGNIMVAGNLVDLSRTYDRTAPSPSITAPSASAYVNEDATMAITADGGSLTAKIGTNTASAYISGTTKISSLSGWGSIAEGGDIAITVYSTDTAGNTGEATITFIKDTLIPTIASGSYSTPASMKTTLTVTADGTGSAISLYTVTGEGVEGTSWSGSDFHEITLVGTVPYAITITVKDEAGNESVGKNVSITELGTTFSIAPLPGTVAVSARTLSSSTMASTTSSQSTAISSASRSTTTSLVTPSATDPITSPGSWLTIGSVEGSAKASATIPSKVASSQGSESSQSKVSVASTTEAAAAQIMIPVKALAQSKDELKIDTSTAKTIGETQENSSVENDVVQVSYSSGMGVGSSGSSDSGTVPPNEPGMPKQDGSQKPFSVITPTVITGSRREEAEE
ncbi:MAG: hypothetical protein RBT62_02480, partial [Spirochaetia bacterium]|nr:hypothetical protein [Spirochaetia bacterium]